MGKLIKGLVAGAVVGAAVSMAIMPQLDRKTQKQLKRTSRRFMNMAEDAYDSVMGYVK